MASPGSQAKDRQANKPGGSGRQTESGGRQNEMPIGGRNVVVTGTNAQGRPLAEAGSPVAPGSRAASQAPNQGRPEGKGTAGGGTTTQEEYTPGAVGNFPDANAAAVADMLSSALPGMGLTNTAYKGAKAAMDGSDPLSANAMGPIGDAFGGNPGPQRGFQPDRYRGNASLGGIGGDGGAVNSGDDEREIAGQRFGAGTQALTGDSEAPIDGGDGSSAFSDDIMLRDRRKPRVGAGTQMLLGA